MALTFGSPCATNLVRMTSNGWDARVAQQPANPPHVKWVSGLKSTVTYGGSCCQTIFVNSSKLENWTKPNTIDRSWAGAWPFQNATTVSSFQMVLTAWYSPWYFENNVFLIGCSCNCKENHRENAQKTFQQSHNHWTMDNGWLNHTNHITNSKATVSYMYSFLYLLFWGLLLVLQ